MDCSSRIDQVSIERMIDTRPRMHIGHMTPLFFNYLCGPGLRSLAAKNRAQDRPFGKVFDRIMN